MGHTAVLASRVANALAQGASIADAANAANAAAEVEPSSDLNASTDYRIHLAKVLVRRAPEKPASSPRSRDRTRWRSPASARQHAQCSLCGR